MRDLETICDKVYNILKGSGYYVQMFDAQGLKTLNSDDALRFFATTPSTDPNRPLLKKYSFLVSIRKDDDVIIIKTPNARKIGKRNFADVLKLFRYMQSAVGDVEDVTVHLARFNKRIMPKDELPELIAESQIQEHQEFETFLQQYTFEHIFLREDQTDEDQAREVLRQYDNNYTAALQALCADPKSWWRLQWEKDPQQALNLLKSYS